MTKQENIYDIAIVGAGPAGLTAAIYGMRAGCTCLVFSGAGLGGQLAQIDAIDNYPGVPLHTNGVELALSMQSQAKELGAQFVSEEVVGVKRAFGQNQSTEGADEKSRNEEGAKKPEKKVGSLNKNLFQVSTHTHQYLAKCVIIATGTSPKKLGLPNENELTGKGISYCATCDGGFFQNKEVSVVGGGNTALSEALFLSRIASQVNLIHRRSEFRGDAIYVNEIKKTENIKLFLEQTVHELQASEGLLSGVVLADTKDASKKTLLQTNALFVAVGTIPNSGNFTSLVECNNEGFIVADEKGYTSDQGIFAAGDVRTKDLRQVVTATSDGASAAMSAVHYLLHER